MQQMQQVSGNVFIPTEVSESIVMPHQDVLVTFRDTTKVKHIPLGAWFTPDIPSLAKKFRVRELSLPKNETDVQKVSEAIALAILEQYTSLKLRIIGGFQTP